MLSDVIVYHIFADESLSVSLRPLHLPSLNNTRIQKNRQKLISFHSPSLIYSSFSSSTLVVYAIASICCAKSDFSKTPYNGERKKKKVVGPTCDFWKWNFIFRVQTCERHNNEAKRCQLQGIIRPSLFHVSDFSCGIVCAQANKCFVFLLFFWFCFVCLLGGGGRWHFIADLYGINLAKQWELN